MRAQRAAGAQTVSTTQTPAPSILTVDDVASRLQISRGAVYELTRFRQSTDMPRLPARKIGRSLRFIAAEIDGWVRALPRHTHLQKRAYNKKDADCAMSDTHFSRSGSSPGGVA